MRRIFFSLALAACTLVSAPALAQSTNGSAGTMPSCASGDPVVWVNTSTKKYHLQGDSYYGKTKHGKYLCKSAADAQSYKLAGSHGSSSSMNGTSHNMGAGANAPASANAMPSPNASGMMTSGSSAKHKHHHRHATTASPGPGMMPSPAAT